MQAEAVQAAASGVQLRGWAALVRAAAHPVVAIVPAASARRQGEQVSASCVTAITMKNTVTIRQIMVNMKQKKIIWIRLKISLMNGI